MMICVFDIESVPDVELLKEVYGYTGSDIEICEVAFTEQEKKNNQSFLPLPFHKIVSISSLIANDYGRPIKIGNFADGSTNERDIIGEFTRFLNKRNPKLVSFNGRGFDMPLIALRAMKYNISLSGYYEVQNEELGKNKWENYRQRYSEKFHIDLFDILGNYGQIRNISFDIVCKMANVAGKYEVNGGDVYQIYYYEKDIEKINHYCQSDVINTYWLFLKFELTRGSMSIEEYLDNLRCLTEVISMDTPYAKVFLKKIDNEINKYQ